MPKRVLRSNAGVTLLELSFAMGVLVICISMMMGALMNMHRSSMTVESKSTAMAALRSVTEQVRGLSFTVLSNTTIPDVVVNGIVYYVTVELENKDGVLVEVPVANGGTAPSDTDFPNPVQTKVTLTWQPMSGDVMSVSTRVLIPSTGVVTIPGS